MTYPQQVDDFNFRRFGRYSEINREERHYGAILFHLLTRPDNVKRILDYASGIPHFFNDGKHGRSDFVFHEQGLEALDERT